MILLHLLDDLFNVLHFYTLIGFTRSVLQKCILGLLVAAAFEFFEDFFCCDFALFLGPY